MSKSPQNRSKNNTAMDSLNEPINEQDEWVRNELTKLWGDDMADYFVNSKIDYFEANKILEDEAHNTASLKLKKKNYNGLYAHQIWRGIREESKNRLKPFDLNTELQKLHYYDKVKNSMDAFVRSEVFNKSKRVNKVIRNDEELMRNKNILDMKRVKEIKSLRNEVELMYRSSKMNEEKFNVLRADSPIPDLNDRDGKETIGRYLPPINFNNDKKKLKIDSKLEFMSSPLMRLKYREKLEEKLSNEKQKVIKTLIENKVMNKEIDGYQPVKMIFLTEQNAADNEWRASVLDHVDNENIIITNTDRALSAEETKEEDLEELKNKRAQVYPPLTLNALIEYKQTIKAPGVGDFKHGKQPIFRLPA